MARFIGSVDDYEKYIGPRIRNIVNTFAKAERDKRQGICEFCGKTTELQSAHKHGKDRKTLIKEALKKYNNGSYLDVDVEKCKNEILELHKPINEVFYFLCMECHRKYDNNKMENIKYKDKIILLEKKENESFQDFVKKTINFLFSNLLIPEDEIVLLQTKEYSQKTFGIDFPLLEMNVNNITIQGHCRYWSSMKFGGQYYCCSQWWKQKFFIYEPLFSKWIKHIMDINGIKNNGIRANGT
jgi:hypothetical protein